jgi:DNA-binding NarL/FixJ family response regulator
MQRAGSECKLMTQIKVLFIEQMVNGTANLRSVLQEESDIVIVGTVVAPNSVRESVGQIPADVVVMNVTWSLQGELDTLNGLLKNEAGTRIVVLVEDGSPEGMFLLLCAGAHGVLLAQTAHQKIADAIHAVYGGGTYVTDDAADIMIPHYLDQRQAKRIADPLKRLSSRERQVLTLVIDGEPSSEIARRLSISPKSVGTYRSRLMKKLGVKDLPSLVKFAIRHDLTSSGPV